MHQKNLIIIILITLVILVGGVVAVTLSQKPSYANLDDFAKCLTEKGLVMYGSATCPHCLKQKALFGSSFKYINYVECPNNISVCTEKGVTGYPTYLIGDQKFEGELTLEKFSQISSCPLPPKN